LDDLDAGDGKAGSIRCTQKAANEKESNVYRMLVNKNHTPPVRFVTLAHELAHLFLGRSACACIVEPRLAVSERVDYR
jgi:Zn-dependent peptidase ImmA (M78 family)